MFISVNYLKHEHDSYSIRSYCYLKSISADFDGLI